MSWISNFVTVNRGTTMTVAKRTFSISSPICPVNNLSSSSDVISPSSVIPIDACTRTYAITDYVYMEVVELADAYIRWKEWNGDCSHWPARSSRLVLCRLRSWRTPCLPRPSRSQASPRLPARTKYSSVGFMLLAYWPSLYNREFLDSVEHQQIAGFLSSGSVITL
jgi:hypothetical protein